MTTTLSVYDRMAVTVPEATHGRLAVERFEVTPNSLENLRLAINGGRQCRTGWYTRLLIDGQVWMSDTTAERHDHTDPALAIDGRLEHPPAERVLIGGLGLGMILQVALTAPAVRHVDVVEWDVEVLELVGPHYLAMAAEAGVELELHHADLYRKRWEPGTSWDVAWFDIWPDLSPDNLEGMGRLNRSYARRTRWKGCWGQHLIRYERDRGRWR